MNILVGSVLTGKVRPLMHTSHLSGIDKKSAQKPVRLITQGLTGDFQADLKYHGGLDKALHHYPYEHYEYWINQIGTRQVLTQPGAFGENLSTVGMIEKDVCIGDIFRIGSAIVQITQARQPCWKLNIRFGQPNMSRLVQETGKTGWYYRVVEEGWIPPGCELTLLERFHPAWNLERILDVLYRRTLSGDELEEILSITILPDSWRILIERRLRTGRVEDWARRLDGE